MQRRFLIFAIFLLAAAGTVFFFRKSPTKTAGLQTFTVNGKTLRVEVMDTEQERNKGLSDRENLPSDTGMLFVFPTPGVHAFWMKDMRFPLDFVWVRDGKIVDLTEQVSPPSPGTPDDKLLIYEPKEPIDAVLEVNAGVVNNLGITEGMQVSWKQ